MLLRFCALARAFVRKWTSRRAYRALVHVLSYGSARVHAFGTFGRASTRIHRCEHACRNAHAHACTRLAYMSAHTHAIRLRLPFRIASVQLHGWSMRSHVLGSALVALVSSRLVPAEAGRASH
eukprot:6182548-Pleurochrysis_carterae.AAC.4